MTEKIACVAASSIQYLHALAALTLQSRQYFAMTMGTQICEIKYGDTG